MLPPLLPDIMAPPLERWRNTLYTLAGKPPQVLLVEGGTEAIRLQFGMYWAMSINCSNSPVPCLECPVCRQIAANENRDIFLYDGRISNAQDLEKPGPIKALRIENIRELKSVIATRPHGNGKKVAIFQGISTTREEAMNSMLKTLEEPGENVIFVLLVPQRSQILPTLVSRSYCITLPWTDSSYQNQDMLGWEHSLAGFLISNSDFLEKISAKGAIDATIAGQLILSCQRAIVRCMENRDREKHAMPPLDNALAPLTSKPQAVPQFVRWLEEAEKMIRATANPVRVLEALSSKLYLLLHQQ